MADTYLAPLVQVAEEDYVEAERLKVQMEEEWAKLEKMRDTARESTGIELPLPAKDEPWHVKRLRRMTPAQREMVSRPDATRAASAFAPRLPVGKRFRPEPVAWRFDFGRRNSFRTVKGKAELVL